MLRIVGDQFRDGKAAMILQCRNAQYSIAAGACEDDTDRMLRAVLRERDQKAIDGGALPRRLLRLANGEPVAMNSRDDIRRAKIDLAAFDGLAVSQTGEFAAIDPLQPFAERGFVQRLAVLQDEYNGLIGAER